MIIMTTLSWAICSYCNRMPQTDYKGLKCVWLRVRGDERSEGTVPASAPQLGRAFLLHYPRREGRKGNITGEERKRGKGGRERDHNLLA